jgi:hypothetical protein
MKPHLACDADIDKMKFPCWGMPKLDGVRMLNINSKALARSLKPHECRFITNKYSKELFAGFDGELTVGDTTAEDVLNKTSSATRTIEWKGDITWNLFDWIPTVRVWENTRKTKSGIQQRICICYGNWEYLVVLTKRKNFILPWTAYPIGYNSDKRKLEKDYNAFHKITQITSSIV